MNALLWLYPRAWRRRYGAEMEALLQQMRGRPRVAVALDLVRGAADAHLHPQRPVRRRRRRLVAALGVLGAAAASAAVAAAAGPARPPLAVALLAGLWLTVSLAGRWLGSRTLFLFSALAAARFPAEWLLALGLARLGAAPPLRVGAGVLEAAVGGVVALLVLRRTRVAAPTAFAVGCLLEVALGVLPQRWPALALMLQPLRVVGWAAALAWLASLRRPRPWDGPPEGAPVAARPSPRAPEPLSARARRAS